jgi:hypothetical protein
LTKPSFTATFYALFLGDQDSVTGHYQRGYTIHGITVYIFPSGGAWSFGDFGYYSTNNSVAFTQYSVDEGDVILDGFNNYYLIKQIKDWTIGDQLQFKELNLEKLAVFPFLSGFFGFEDEDHGTVGGMFEDGFERGAWAL